MTRGRGRLNRKAEIKVQTGAECRRREIPNSRIERGLNEKVVEAHHTARDPEL